MPPLSPEQDDQQRWAKFWFDNGGWVHGHFKYRRWTCLKRLAEQLPKLAWDHQQQEISRLRALVSEQESQRDNLCMLLRRLVAFNKHLEPEPKVVSDAKDYLNRIGGWGEALRSKREGTK